MGRKSHSRSLSVWSNGERVGTWTIPTRGETQFLYDKAWRASAVGRPLSLSLPYTGDQPLRGDVVRDFFDNLLPDSEPIRKRLASQYKLASIEAFDLLQEIGRDCVGAVQLLKEDEAPTNVKRIDGSPMSEEDVERHLIRLRQSGPLGRGEDADDLRISLAGAQEKTALLWHEGGWMRPHGSTPTTHILKLPLGLVGHRKADLTASVENEWLCMNLLAEFGLPVARTAILNFGSQTVLGVERFDRRMHPSGKWIMRLPQEDFCQALGVPSQLKYESDGGPGLADLAAVLRGSERAREDLTTLLTSQVLFWLMAAPDGHAKNFSIHLLPGGRYALAPLYDVMSIWPLEGGGANQYSLHKARMAMAMLGKNKHYRFSYVQRRHFNSTAARYFLRTDAEDIIERVLAKTRGAIEAVAARLSPGFPERVAATIFAGIERSAMHLRG
ncbi:type II toxin-antitoxin system HipA family toxin [Duganella callida]|uniref:Type II toxin-antitoxin system HipA family toxin n=1 Tax=Duganella callida TaxID=2561932 RepID=A0A4Y9SZE1_9BURK|nr:type II toxin-antitoxin system HipA family toxin [Duganella callida]TFW30931.1 type II toxin-antitoxin system HipA family toxin [Duganella callida]